MAYYLGNGVWNKVFAVPCDIVDKHIKLCSPLSLKVLMVVLRRGGEIDIDQLAETLGQSRADVQDAINYWLDHGVIHIGNPPEPAGHTEQALAPVKTETVKTPEPARPAYDGNLKNKKNEKNENDNIRKVEALTSSRPKLTTQDINEMAKNDKSIGYLLQETQHIMGKPLTPIATEVIATLNAYYGMQPDLILMLIQYCVSIGKDSVRYIEKVAATWIENGVDSHERAEAEILRLTGRNQAENKIKKLFGIGDRALVSSERKYIETWFEEWKLEFPLVEVAFERSVELKGKLSFAYINGILSNWYQKNVRTPAQAMHEISRGKSEAPHVKASSKASYDMSELESMISGGGLNSGMSKK